MAAMDGPLCQKWSPGRKPANGGAGLIIAGNTIRQNNLYINDKLHARVLDAKLHTLSSTKHHSTTTDTLQPASHGQCDAQQMDTNQLNLEHQQSDTVEPISKKVMTEHQESVTNEPTLDNKSNQQNESVSAPQSSPRQSHTSTTTKETPKPMESS